MPDFVFDTKHDRYPIAVHVLLLHNSRILLMRRAGTGFADGLLTLPAGHVDLGETPTESAVRELDLFFIAETCGAAPSATTNPTNAANSSG